MSGQNYWGQQQAVPRQFHKNSWYVLCISKVIIVTDTHAYVAYVMSILRTFLTLDPLCLAFDVTDFDQ